MLAYKAAHAALSARLEPRTVAHSERVAETAGRLAEAYGVDPDRSRLAGLLHDWAKDEPYDTLLAEARRLGVGVSAIDERIPELLHARVGAAQLRESFPDLPDDILSAVSRHTMGEVRMSDLDRVVYLADSIEPGRRYEGAEDLRQEVGLVPLSDLFLRSLASGIAYIVATRRPLHPKTVEVWNAALEEVRAHDE